MADGGGPIQAALTNRENMNLTGMCSARAIQPDMNLSIRNASFSQPLAGLCPANADCRKRNTGQASLAELRLPDARAEQLFVESGPGGGRRRRAHV